VRRLPTLFIGSSAVYVHLIPAGNCSPQAPCVGMVRSRCQSVPFSFLPPVLLLPALQSLTAWSEFLLSINFKFLFAPRSTSCIPDALSPKTSQSLPDSRFWVPPPRAPPRFLNPNLPRRQGTFRSGAGDLLIFHDNIASFAQSLKFRVQQDRYGRALVIAHILFPSHTPPPFPLRSCMGR